MGSGGFAVKEFTKIAVDYDKGRRGEDVGFWAGEAERLGDLVVHVSPQLFVPALHDHLFQTFDYDP